MSHWDAKAGTIVRWPTEPVAGYPEWELVDCGCSAGTEWGGEQPIECRDCWGTGRYCRHRPTKTLALYPGGPLLGREAAAS